ncbi:MAG: hypothetical protein K2Y39_14080 [Candidatus Obscuribacterales bacterium]|nr:hypothetical protein [Candidatus Obscuribacterales bacterium]
MKYSFFILIAALLTIVSSAPVHAVDYEFEGSSSDTLASDKKGAAAPTNVGHPGSWIVSKAYSVITAPIKVTSKATRVVVKELATPGACDSTHSAAYRDSWDEAADGYQTCAPDAQQSHSVAMGDSSYFAGAPALAAPMGPPTSPYVFPGRYTAPQVRTFRPYSPIQESGYGYGWTNPHVVHVNGYFRSNGTYVSPHWRTAANHTMRDNFSTRGNVNPFTGRRGTVRARY